jgi:hypothetical protein
MGRPAHFVNPLILAPPHSNTWGSPAPSHKPSSTSTKHFKRRRSGRQPPLTSRGDVRSHCWEWNKRETSMVVDRNVSRTTCSGAAASMETETALWASTATTAVKNIPQRARAGVPRRGSIRRRCGARGVHEVHGIVDMAISCRTRSLRFPHGHATTACERCRGAAGPGAGAGLLCRHWGHRKLYQDSKDVHAVGRSGGAPGGPLRV